MPEVIGIQFAKKNQDGDFGWMIKQDQYKNSLFIFNDDTESINTYQRGGGNACVRPYNSNNPNNTVPKSAGIPTGSRKLKSGFKEFDIDTKGIVDEAIQKIKYLIEEYSYESIYYSAKKSGKLGTNIFAPCEEVISYITQEIKSLENL